MTIQPSGRGGAGRGQGRRAEHAQGAVSHRAVSLDDATVDTMKVFDGSLSSGIRYAAALLRGQGYKSVEGVEFFGLIPAQINNAQLACFEQKVPHDKNTPARAALIKPFIDRFVEQYPSMTPAQRNLFWCRPIHLESIEWEAARQILARPELHDRFMPIMGPHYTSVRHLFLAAHHGIKSASEPSPRHPQPIWPVAGPLFDQWGIAAENLAASRLQPAL